METILRILPCIHSLQFIKKKQWVAVFWGSSSTSGELILPKPWQIEQGRIQEGKGSIPLPEATSNFFTNIILHRRVLFYTFTDITVMLLSRDSLY